MMKFRITFNLLFLLIIILTVSIVSGSHFHTTNFSHPDYPKKCYINKDLIVEPGRHKHPQYICQEIECREDGTGDIITSHPGGCEY